MAHTPLWLTHLYDTPLWPFVHTRICLTHLLTLCSHIHTLYFTALCSHIHTAQDPTLSFESSLGFTLGGYYIMTDEYANLNMKNDHFNGWIDNFAIHRRALSSDEITQCGQEGIPLDPALDSDLTIFYDFEDALHSNFTQNLGSAGSVFDLLLGASYKGSSHMGPLLGEFTEQNTPQAHSQRCRTIG